jgi:hypothetical protein
VALVIFHILRSLLWQRLATMFSPAATGGAVAGKYSVAQKLMHLALTLMVLAAVVTGLLMLKKIRTPLLVRDPYYLGADTWGVVYFIHGLAAIVAVTLVIGTLGTHLKAAIVQDSVQAAQDAAAFLDAVVEDAAKAQGAIALVLSRAAIGSLLVDNLNASIHLRALLTDVFLIDQALRPR